MSLIIIVSVPEYVVQVSDMRLTRTEPPYGAVDERQRKALVLNGTGVRLLVGWVGLAKVGAHNTADWLIDQLVESGAAKLNLPEVLKALADRATRQFASLPIPRNKKSTSFVLAGWGHTVEGWRQVLGMVSNFESTETGAPLAEVQESFSSGFWHAPSKSRPAKYPCMVFVFGPDNLPARPALQCVGLRKLLKRRPKAEVVMRICIRLARDVAAERATVGPNLIAVELRRDHWNANATYFPEACATPWGFGPDYVTPDRAFKEISTWTGDTPPPWW